MSRLWYRLGFPHWSGEGERDKGFSSLPWALPVSLWPTPEIWGSFTATTTLHTADLKGVLCHIFGELNISWLLMTLYSGLHSETLKKTARCSGWLMTEVLEHEGKWKNIWFWKANVEEEGTIHDMDRLLIICHYLLKMLWKYSTGERVRISYVDVWVHNLFEWSQLLEKSTICLRTMK